MGGENTHKKGDRVMFPEKKPPKIYKGIIVLFTTVVHAKSPLGPPPPMEILTDPVFVYCLFRGTLKFRHCGKNRAS